MTASNIIVLAALVCPGVSDSAPEPGTHAHYAVLTARVRTPPPFEAVDLVYGPRQKINGAPFLWWQLEVRAKNDLETAPLFRLRALTSADPLALSARRLRFESYVLQCGETGEALEYRDSLAGNALLPPWRRFQRYFLPRRARGSGVQRGVPESAEYLGHVLTLQWAGHGVAWEKWNEVRKLDLDRELLVGTGRSFRDKEGHRLPQKPERRNYTYVPFTEEDYREMIGAGINLFVIRPDQERWVRSQPVFYHRGAGGNPPLRYPGDLYRSNYLGPVMFMDEPSIIMVGDKHVHNTLRYFSDAAALIEKRVRERYRSSGNYGAFKLERELAERGVNLGDMRLEQHDYPSWETLFETAHYQLAGGLAGIVHEGRYRLKPFDEAVAHFTGEARKHTAEELLRYHFSFLRGAARAHGKHWGTAIYGQCDPQIAPRAVTLAYDMGARYIWFWTSDHDHHLPWPEQLALARVVRRHAADKPRPSIFGSPPTLNTAIVIPYGYFISLRNLWWVRVLDPGGKNQASREYRRLVRRVLSEAHRALEAKEDFDIVVNDGREIRGYRQVISAGDR